MRHPRGRWPERDELARLARAAQRDEPRALDALLTTLRPPFDLFFARRITRDTAEDLTQAALIRIAGDVEHMDPERVGHHVNTLARTLLHTEYLREERALRRCAPITLGRRMTSPCDIERQTEYEDLVHALHRASASTLPPELGAVVLGLLRDQSLSEIAAELGVDPVTIRMRLLRARALLRRELWAYTDRGIRTGAPVTAPTLRSRAAR
jgi:RNA polymerase sigma factor (sigma-70 family)